MMIMMMIPADDELVIKIQVQVHKDKLMPSLPDAVLLVLSRNLPIAPNTNITSSLLLRIPIMHYLRALPLS